MENCLLKCHGSQVISKAGVREGKPGMAWEPQQGSLCWGPEHTSGSAQRAARAITALKHKNDMI